MGGRCYWERRYQSPDSVRSWWERTRGGGGGKMCYLNRRRAIRDRHHGVDRTPSPSGQRIHGAIVGRGLELLFSKSLVPVSKTVLFRR